MIGVQIIMQNAFIGFDDGSKNRPISAESNLIFLEMLGKLAYNQQILREIPGSSINWEK